MADDEEERALITAVDKALRRTDFRQAHLKVFVTIENGKVVTEEEYNFPQQEE